MSETSSLGLRRYAKDVCISMNRYYKADLKLFCDFYGGLDGVDQPSFSVVMTGLASDHMKVRAWGGRNRCELRIPFERAGFTGRVSNHLEAQAALEKLARYAKDNGKEGKMDGMIISLGQVRKMAGAVDVSYGAAKFVFMIGWVMLLHVSFFNAEPSQPSIPLLRAPSHNLEFFALRLAGSVFNLQMCLYLYCAFNTLQAIAAYFVCRTYRIYTPMAWLMSTLVFGVLTTMTLVQIVFGIEEDIVDMDAREEQREADRDESDENMPASKLSSKLASKKPKQSPVEGAKAMSKKGKKQQ